MTEPTIAGDIGQVEVDTLCVLFDAVTGKIQYTHQVITLTGGTHPEPAQIESTARKLAEAAGKKLANPGVLHLDGHAMDAPGVYIVDVVTKGLVFKTLEEAGLGGLLHGTLPAGGGILPGL